MKKGAFWAFSLLIVALFAAAPALAKAGALDLSQAGQGYVHVYYNSEKQLHVGVSVDGGVERHHAYTAGEEKRIPLPPGGDHIAVRLYEHAGGHEFRVVAAQSVTLSTGAQAVPETPVKQAGGSDPAATVPVAATTPTAASSYQAFLRSVPEIRFAEGDAVHKKAQELIKNKTTTEQKAMAIYSYIAANFTYDWSLYDAVRNGEVKNYTPDPNAALRAKTGVCYDIASLYAAMLRSVGIPAKMIKGNSVPAGGYHAWNSVYDSERDAWVELDVTLNLGSKATSKYKPLSDGYTAQSEV